MPTKNIGDPLQELAAAESKCKCQFQVCGSSRSSWQSHWLDSRQRRITSCSSAPWRKVQVSLHDLAMAAQTAIAKGPLLPLADKGSRCDTASLDSVTKRPCLRV